MQRRIVKASLLNRALTCCALSILVGSVSIKLGAAPYTFLEGYTVLDEANLPGVGTNVAFTAGIERGFGVDVDNGIIYISRGFTTTQDGRTNTTAAAFAAITTTNGFGGGNFTDTGLIAEQAGQPALFFSNGEIVPDLVNNRFFFQAQGTNPVSFLSVVYEAPRGTLGGAPAGGNPSAVNNALTAAFQVDNDLTNANGSFRDGIPRGIAARTINGITTVFLALGNHAEAWRNDATNGSPQYPWRRLWGTQRAPIQNTVALRMPSGDTRLNGIEVDDEGNCYFSVEFTLPGRIWRVPANAADIAADPWSLDFDDRAVGGSNSNANSVIKPVITRTPSPAMTLGGTNTFYGPQDLTFFRADNRQGFFVSCVAVIAPARTAMRGIARLVIDELTVDTNGYPFMGAAIVDAFGSSAAPKYQDTILQTMRLKSATVGGGVTQPLGGATTDMLYTQVNSLTNPTVLYFQAYLTDTNKGQTVPTAAIAKAAIPPLPLGPALVSISPVSGTTSGGDVITLTGSNFVSGATVTVGLISATVNFSNANLMTVVSPAHAAGVVSLTVQNPDGQISTLSNSFTYLAPPAPSIVTVSPTSGPTAGGTLVTITGANFVDGASVLFGANSAASVNFSNSTLITAVTPANAAETVNITVQNPDLQSAVTNNAFTFLAPPPAPAITTIAPTNGLVPGGTLVTITGSNFVSGLTVMFGASNAASVNFSNSTLITAVTPAHPAALVDVIVQNPDLQIGISSNAFSFELPPPPAPAIATISPTNGPVVGSTLVTITGSNFVSGITVSFGASSATSVNFSNSTLITALTPAHVAGAVNVTVKNPDLQSATAIAGFTFEALPPFQILSISRLNPDAIEIIWESTPTVIYEVQGLSDLSATNWTTLGTVTATNNTASFTNTGVSTNATGYYRVGRLP